MKALMTFWISTPQPDVSSTSSVISTLDGLTRPLVAFGAVVGLVVGGSRLVWTARHEQSAQAILRGLLLMTVVTAGGATIVELLLTGFDLLAKAVLDDGFDGTSVGDRLAALGTLPTTGSGLVFLLAFFGMLAALVQVGIMLVRGAILAVLVGLLPVAAAASITEAGFSWFKRLCGWVFSFTVYKLAAAVIYAAAFTLIGNATDLAGTVSGFGLMIVAILALPALLRLLPPSAEAMAGGSGGALAGGLAAAATGAALLAGGRSSSPAPTSTPGLKSDANGPGPSSPSGANGAGTGAGAPTLPTSSSGGGSGVERSSGSTGPTGPAGPGGPAGPSGSTGPGGPAGPGGPTGPGGPAGPAGPSGPVGAGSVAAGAAAMGRVVAGARSAASGAAGEGGGS